MSDGPKICIDARLESGQSGGIEQVVIGLAQGLSSLEDGDERYLFLAYPGADDWLRPYLGPNCETLYCKRPWQRQLRRTIARKYPRLRRLLERIAVLAVKNAVTIPQSNGEIEAAGIDLMHFTQQAAFLTDIPSIYHPHDLQHIHLPEYFSDYERRGRTIVYRHFCEQANLVAVSSSWVRNDLEVNLGIAQDRVCVVPLAPPTEAYAVPDQHELDEVREKFNLPAAFAFYPAQTWPHKNHLNLIRAAAHLKGENGIEVPLVFSGRKTDFYPILEQESVRLGVADQVRFLGFVTTKELQSLYRLSRCVIIPTRFEAASFPLWESFLAGAPTACSNVTSLPRQAGTAALIFNPDEVGEIASCIQRLWQDAALRETLASRGKTSVDHFTWQRTALYFRAYYRLLLGRGLADEDRSLLSLDPLL